MSTPLLQVRELRAGYGDVQILHGLSLEAPDAAITALLGANGSGKTTLMRTLCGLLPVWGGKIFFQDEDITAWPAHRRVEAGLVLVPEGRLVFGDLSVEDNLHLGAITPKARVQWRARRDEMFDLFPRLLERRSQSAITLSGGEQQMLAIARGLMAHPRLLLLDEPTLGLAPIACRQVFALLGKLNTGALAVLLSEQDVRSSLALAREAYVVENGSVALSGPASALQEDSRIKQAYLGL
jgi:branched-chain amino acid transport system ATP-binding protein